jgi:excinuclease ABC subunit A
VNGSVIDVREALKAGGENPLGLGRYEMHDIEAVVDRVVARAEDRQRIAESVETALKLGEGNLLVLVEGPEGTWAEHRYSERFSCPDHPECALEELEPRIFSFNSPQGACPTCAGLGHVQEFDESLVVPDATVPFSEAIEPWRRNGPRMNMFYARAIRNFGAFFKLKPSTPFDKLPAKVRGYLMNGIPEREREALGGKFEGVLPNLKRRFEESESEFVKERLLAYMSAAPCPACAGSRLKPASLAVRLRSGTLGVSIADATAMSIERALGFFSSLELGAMERKIAEPVLKEIDARLGFLASVGLGYLTLDRSSGTLSGGEAQRIRLATQVGSGLVGVAYVLDEPTIGLHQRDNDRLLATLRRLADIGNTVLVVEHDEDVIRAADHLVDVGPGPGRHGGRIVAQGSVDDVARSADSLTGAYLSGRRAIAVPAKRRTLSEDRAIVVKGARENNLKSVDAAFPLGGLVCVTGVSGSGKSTLVSDILLKAAQKHVHGTKCVPGAHDRVNGLAGIERVVEVDQSPIGRTPRSNPATYTGIFDEIRKHFAKVPEAKIRGYEPGRFSFNVKGGRCEACQGQGTVKIEMHFLPDVFVACDTCKGARYNRETLEIRFKGKSIAEVLDMTVDDAIAHFDAYPKVRGMLECLRDVGLGYMQLGQASTTVSGGEAQRIKLATELGNMSSASTLYVLDEPTTGLHFADVEKLLAVLQRLADSGHTLVVIEHSLDVVKCADWLVDLGPEGGERGGTIIATGTPEDVARNPASHTGRYLKPILERAGTMPGGRGAVTPAAAPASRTRAPASSRPRSGTPRARS